MSAAERARELEDINPATWREMAGGALTIVDALYVVAPWWGRVALRWVRSELREWIEGYDAQFKGVPDGMRP